MTLQDKIQKKAEGFGKLAPVFLEGAEFALNNQWISVNDDLPCNHDELKPNSYATYKVIVLLNDGRIRETYMFYDKWVQYGKKITHWKPFIEPPKEQEIKLWKN